MKHPGEQEEAVYIGQVRRYRRRFRYTMAHDRRDLRAEKRIQSTAGPRQHEIVPSPDRHTAR